MKVTGDIFSFTGKKPKGQDVKKHLNSQAKGPLLDRPLESFSINTEGVISNILEKSLR